MRCFMDTKPGTWVDLSEEAPLSDLQLFATLYNWVVDTGHISPAVPCLGNWLIVAIRGRLVGPCL